ncbi:MAG TPA: hypothetical protein VMW15_09035 [Terracidiphilus sp.]|nr:hypothetical protein [Terracidiphilus sp.]
MRIALTILTTAILFTPSLLCAAQAPVNGAPPTSAPARSSISATLQPSLTTVRRTLDSLHIEKWKRGSIRDEASQNIDAIEHDLQANLPPLLQDADSAPGSVSKTLPLDRHVNALYDVLLRVVEAARVIAPEDQAAQLQQALAGLSSARLELSNRIQGSADAIEKQVVELRATIEAQAARRPEPAPVALPCVPPAKPHRATRRKTTKPPAKPAQSKPATTPSTSNSPK